MNTLYLLLGSNMGNSQKQLHDAIINTHRYIGKIVRKSGIYQTAAWGNTKQPDFLNQIIIVETLLSPAETMQAIHLIEKNMGRIRTVKNAPRVIDIDILFFNKDIVQQKDLIIPHPEIPNRRFVLVPLNELSPNLKHPFLQKTNHQLLKACKDELNVQKF